VKKLIFRLLDLNYYADLNNRLVSRDMQIRPFGFELNSEDKCAIVVWNTYERLDDPFEIFTHVSIPQGLYSWWNWGIDGATSPSRPLSVKFESKWGDFYDGRGTFVKSTITYKRNRFYSLSADFTYDDVSVRIGDFIARAIGGRFTLDLSTRLNSSTFVQWNNETNEMNVNFRLRYIPNIGSDVYLVYDHLLNEERDFRTIRRAAGFKVAYPIRM
jgi:hypothetical protein